ncbi:MAG: PadR family transcriptional regulator [Nostocales cyanobacterium]|nr:MAG: PadR family transcriptional regulator [Nostocales cyanobacterium]TAF21424.1 MAG: PadR family transcriptional regulator [Nostocales cyanobacterium]
MSLSHALLTCLIETPQSGYDLSKRFSESVSYFWNASQQQIYRELGKLETQGYVVSEVIPREGRLDKKIYSITEEGKEYLIAWMKKPSEPDTIREDILVKIFSGSLVETKVLIADIKRRQKIHVDKLSKYKEIEEKNFAKVGELTKEEKLKYLVLKAGIRCELEWLDWCQEALEIVNSIT